MQITLSIDDDVLLAARHLAEQEKRTLGEVISALARKALQRQSSMARVRADVPLLQSNAESSPVTMALVNRLRDEIA